MGMRKRHMINGNCIQESIGNQEPKEANELSLLSRAVMSHDHFRIMVELYFSISLI